MQTDSEASAFCLRPTAPATFTLKEKRSEFIAALFPAACTQDAKAAYDSVRREHFSATHNCPAWRTGFPDIEEFSSDDGEPGGTAGRPILGVLQKNSLCNVAVVVTRYFGGVKLGVRGLIDAYTAAAAGAVERSQKETAVPLRTLLLSCSYEHLSSLNYVIKTCGVLPTRIRTGYAENVTLRLLVTPYCERRLTAALSSYENSSLMTLPPQWGKIPELAAKIEGEK